MKLTLRRFTCMWFCHQQLMKLKSKRESLSLIMEFIDLAECFAINSMNNQRSWNLFISVTCQTFLSILDFNFQLKRWCWIARYERICLKNHIWIFILLRLNCWTKVQAKDWSTIINTYSIRKLSLMWRLRSENKRCWFIKLYWSVII
jgi:hypothetical protein